MKKMALFILLLFPLSSWSLVTVRASYTGLVAGDALSDVCKGTACAGQTPSMVPLYGLGGDAIISLPVIPFGFGLRYENLGLKASKNNIEGDAKLTRTSLLVNYRFIDTIIHFGLIGSYGLAHSGHLTVKNNGANTVDYRDGKHSSYSLGLELEAKPLVILPLVIGGEAGYMNVDWKDAKDGVSGNNKSIDLSGTYLKVFLGLDF